MWNDIVGHVEEWAPSLVMAVVSIFAVIVVHRLLQRRHARRPNSHLGVIGPVTTLATIGIGLISTILTLPIGDAGHGQLLGLLGLLVTGAIALSSTTFLGNALAGIMLRAIRSFRAGDYVRIGEHAGRVSDLGILHTELQTEDRDLTTLPNLYLVTNPVTVLRESGTVISAQVSIGYDISRILVEKQLVEAATRAGLTDPFVQVVELGDFSILYRAAGFLTDIKQIISTRSNLRKSMLDTLHEAEIEIVSPTFINQRRIPVDAVVMPTETRRTPRYFVQSPEARIFDKADAAEAKSRMQDELEGVVRTIAEIQAKIDQSGFEAEKTLLVDELANAKQRLKTLTSLIKDGDLSKL